MVSVTITGLDEAQALLAVMPLNLNSSLMARSQDLLAQLAQKVDDDLSGEVLNAKSGRLRSAIATDLETTGHGLKASIFVDGGVPYARILEYGGTTKAHVIEAAQGKALAFAWQGKETILKYVQHPGSVIAPHSYLGSAMTALEPAIADGFEASLEEIAEA